MSSLRRVLFWLQLAIVLNIVQEAAFSISGLEYVYQKDMSEYCRRSVIPSVFLGRHVMASQTQMLHFTQLEVPYSCFIVVRTESGSNIILVLNTVDDGEEEACYGPKESQVSVYELGETFGGYWGPLPKVVLPDNQPTPSHLYTRPTTRPTSPPIAVESTEEETTLPTTSVTSITQKKTKKDYIRVEIPLVNVSGPFTYDADFIHRLENYDRLNEALRSPGVSYHSTLVPLVQFSLANLPLPVRRREGDPTPPPWPDAAPEATVPEPRYDLEFNPAALAEDDDDVTVDLDFLLGSTTPVRRTGKKFRYNANRLRKFKKNKGQLFTPATYKKSTINPFDVYSTMKLMEITPVSTKATKTLKSWQYIEDLLKKLKNSTYKEYTAWKPEDYKYKNVSTLLQNIAENQNNQSAYLDPSLWTLEPHKKENATQKQEVTTQKQEVTTQKQEVTTQKQEVTTHALVSPKSTNISSTKILINSSPTLTSTFPITSEAVAESSSSPTSFLEQTSGATTHSSITSVSVSETAEDALSTTTPYTQETSAKDIGTDRGRLVHAKGEVKSTEMAHLLAERDKTNSVSIRESTNQSNVNGSNKTSSGSGSASTGRMVDRESWQNVVQVAPAITGILNKSGSATVSQKHLQTRKSIRGKRFIQPIAINYARPHPDTTLKEVATTAESTYQFSDAQDFAQLVELEDDNVYGRISMRYLKKYEGQLLFDLCEYNKSKGHHVFLFKSSRIVIEINNFTMKSMTMVATPARTLMRSDARCDSDYIECTVANARVCVDGMAACDGVPNCGAYDLYDEDRLRCGAFSVTKHSVVLAALVFLLVLLTLIYTVHYWLKRCVPSVSKAFFIYTNGSENVLYLDTIMRSPNDFDSESRLAYTSHIFDPEDLSLVLGLDNYRKKKSILNKFCSLFSFNRHSKVVQSTTEPDSIDMEVIDTLRPDDNRKQQPQQRLQSLADLELAKLMRKHTENIGVQTGGSLEIAQNMGSNVRSSPRPFINQSKRGSTDSPRRSHNSELSLLLFIKNAKQAEQKKQAREVARPPPLRERDRRGSSRECASRDVAIGDEEEMHSTFYESSKFMPAEDSFAVTAEIHEDPKLSRKRLRFQETTTAIGTEEGEITEERTNQWNVHGEPPAGPEVEHGGREFMRFFGGKSKRTKKKPHSHLNKQ